MFFRQGKPHAERTKNVKFTRNQHTIPPTTGWEGVAAWPGGQLDVITANALRSHPRYEPGGACFFPMKVGVYFVVQRIREPLGFLYIVECFIICACVF